MVSSKKFQQFADRVYLEAMFHSEEEEVARLVGKQLEDGRVVGYVLMLLLDELEQAVCARDEERVRVIKRFFSFGIWGQE